MNMMKQALLTSTLLICSASSFAAPQPHEGPEPGDKGFHAIMPPPPAPTYAVTEQTSKPNEALNNIVKNTPVMEQGKKYEVRVEVRELPPAPPAPKDPQIQ